MSFPLHDACINGDLDACQQSVRPFVDAGDTDALRKLLTSKDDDERTPIHWMCTKRNGHQLLDWAFELYRKSMAAAGDAGPKPVAELIMTQDSSGFSPLMSACSVGNVDSVRALLAYAHSQGLDTACASVRNEQGNSAAHYAASKGHCDVLRLLPSSLFTVANNLGHTPLSRAVLAGRLACVKYLTSPPVFQSGQVRSDAAGDTLFHFAVEGQHVELMRYLLRHRRRLGLDPAAENKQKVQVSALMGGADVLQNLILKVDAEPSTADDDAD